mgnify:CR=1 FL=1
MSTSEKFNSLSEIQTKDDILLLLKECNIDEASIPHLKADNTRGSTGYVVLGPLQMAAGLMTFSDNHTYGFAFRIVNKPEEKLTSKQVGLKRCVDVNKIDSVVVFFNRYGNSSDLICHFSGGTQEFRWIINRLHDDDGHIGSMIDACPTCPIVGQKMKKQFLIDLILGKNKHFKIFNDNKIKKCTD